MSNKIETRKGIGGSGENLDMVYGLCDTKCDREAASFILREWQTAIDKRRAGSLYQILHDSRCMSSGQLCTKYHLNSRVKRALNNHNATQIVYHAIDQMRAFGYTY